MSTKTISFNYEGFKATISASADREVKEALSAQSHVTDRYLKLEPAISAAFGAPSCYERGTPARKALLAYLQERHPLAPDIGRRRAEQEAAAAKGQHDEAHRLGKLAQYDEEKRDVDVQNAIRAFRRYFEVGKQGQRSRDPVSPRKKAEDFVKSMERYFAEKSEWPAADQKLAKACYDAVRAVLDRTPAAGPQVAAPRTIGMENKKPGEVKILTAEEIEAIEA